MNKIERFRAVLRGDAVDRVPAGFWFHTGAPMAQRHIDYYRRADPDIMKVMNDSGYSPIGRVKVFEPADWARLEPTPVSDAAFQGHIEGLGAIVQAVGDEVLVMTTAFSPYHRAVAILQHSDPKGLPDEAAARRRLLSHCRQAPEAVLGGLEVIAHDLGGYYAACIRDAGANGIYYSAQGGERELFSDEEHARFIKAQDLQVLSRINSEAEFVVGHFCGAGLNLERFADYPVQMVNWAAQAANPSLRKGRELFGEAAILGGMDERGPLVRGPREEIRREIRAALDEMGDRSFMLGAGCTVPGDVDVSNLAYARQVVGEMTAAG